MDQKYPQQEQYPQGAPPPYPGQGPAYPPQGQYPPQGYPQGQYPPSSGPYPQGSYHPAPCQYPQPQPAQTVVVQAVPMRFGETPVTLKCYHCHADIVTGTNYVSGLMTWLLAGACCLVGLWAGCCLIPFCIDGVKDVVHTCPNCQRVVGTYQRLS